MQIGGRYMKKLLSFLLALVMLLGISTPALAASAKAVTMRIQLVEGSVTIKDASGVALSFFEDMQLYSGYSIETGVDSCAYISLDDSKAIKLDMNTSVTIKKSGRKLQVKLTAGQIVFNVTAPLAGNEALEIRTSTMVTGIRGSSGIVTLRKVIYGTGHGTVYQFDELGALPKSFEIWGGQLLELNDNGSEAKISEAKVSDFPTVYLKEVESNEQLQQSLTQEGNYSTDELIAEIPVAEQKEQTDREEKESNVAVPSSDDENDIREVNAAFIITDDEGDNGSNGKGENGAIIDENGGIDSGDEDDNASAVITVPDIPSIPEAPVNPLNPVEPEPESHTITWKNGNTVLKTDTVIEGTLPSFTGDEPAKAADAQYTYTFSGWMPEPAPVTDDVTYTAQFTGTLRTYSVTFVDEDGTVLKAATEYDYGTKAEDIARPADPSKADTARDTFVFAGWSPDISDVTGDVTYKATYSNTTQKYTVTFVDEDGTVLKAAREYDYGTKAEDIAKPADPSKAADAQYTYTFDGWAPTIADVTKDTIYTASYSSEINT